ncbi:MAG: DUF2079 domain-containing protein [Bacteroidales bacterium]|nr:DUF2079 domain-containing protein [Bacteroidales bacterium]
MVFTVAGALYCLISLVNHYLFKTYALDLGLYTHAMYDYAHFRIDDCSMFKGVPQSILSDHFDLYLVILSPLVYVFGSYTLLIVQIAAVLLGGWGIHKFIGLFTDDPWLPILATASFFFSFGIIQALGYDYHSNVLTAMMLPWMLYYLKKRRFGWASLFVVLFVIGKENMSLWLFFIALGLMWDYRKDKQTLWLLAAYALFSIVYFFMVNMVVMPKLGGSGGGFSRYAYLGKDYSEVAKTLVTHPFETVKILFTNTLGVPHYDGIKAEFYGCALATGMILTLFKPNYLLMLIPLIAQKMLAADRMFWGVSLQYSVEFMPVLVISSFLVIVRLKKRLTQLLVSVVLLLSTLLTTFYTIGVPKSYIMVDQLCVYQGRHYQQKGFDTAYARELIGMIPSDASVCAGRMFVPHLALRPKIYDYYAVAPHVRTDYVLVPDDYLGMTRGGKPLFYYRDEYEVVATDGSLTLFRRKRS